jgi:hypothetical protein
LALADLSKSAICLLIPDYICFWSAGTQKDQNMRLLGGSKSHLSAIWSVSKFGADLPADRWLTLETARNGFVKKKEERRK